MEQFPFSIYKPSERFADLAKSDLAKEMWHCVSSEQARNKMLDAISNGEAPVAPIDTELHEMFSEKIDSMNEDESELRILCMNMMKQILEFQGYEHVGCALRANGQFVKSAGIFKRVNKLC